MNPEDFDDVIQDQFSIREQEAYSSESAFPYLDPAGKVAELGVQLQLDALNGTISTIHIGERLEDIEKDLSQDAIKLLAASRLAIFGSFYQRIAKHLYNPGERPEPAILYLGGAPLVWKYPGENASSDRLFDWALALACRQTFDELQAMNDLLRSMRSNLNQLVSHTFVTYRFDRENFQELLEG
ncbi:MAG TPA: hypothetical protein VHC21_04750 [Candidatus Saccharimonadales bacterium]|nr:hypothetical protein [Candidatus Saccharimonadales bacterium]